MWIDYKKVNNLSIAEAYKDLLEAEENQDELNKLFTSLEFKTWVKSSPASRSDIPVTPKSKKEYQVVLTENDLKAWAKKIDNCKVFAVDTETSSLDTMTADLIGISLACNEGEGCYIPIKHAYDGMPKQIPLNLIQKILGAAITKNQKKLVGQNLKFDLPMLNRHGINVDEFLGDTMLMSYVLNSTGTRHGLDRLAVYYLNYEPMKYEEVVGSASKQINFAQVEIPAATFYAAEDADITLRLFNKLSSLLKGKKGQIKLLQEIEYPLVHVLAAVEKNGAKIDKNKLAAHSQELSEKISELTSQAFAIAGEEFNLDSPKQLLEILYDKLQLPVLKKTPKGQPSTNEETLQRLSEEYDLPKIILQYRTLAKLKSTYTDSLIKIENPKTKVKSKVVLSGLQSFFVSPSHMTT